MKQMKFVFLVLSIVFLTTGCSLRLSSTSAGGGVYKSFDYGENWEAKNFVGISDKKEITIAGVNTREIIFDKQDHTLVFLATREHGLFISENAGEVWRNIFASGFISSVAPDPNNRGVIYLSTANRVYKSIDLGKTWREIYINPKAGVMVSQIVVDPLNSGKILATTTDGQIIISLDAGESWNLKTQIKGEIRKVLINPIDSNKIYLATLKKGVYKSNDGGDNWQNLADNYSSIDSSNKIYRLMVLNPHVEDGLFLISKYGIISTVDGGETWQELNLLIPNKSILINAFAINPQNANQMYYATSKLIYRTFDGGASWLSSKVATSRDISYLTIDPQTPNVLYLGVYKSASKPFFFI